jgi:hypothetical protein
MTPVDPLNPTMAELYQYMVEIDAKVDSLLVEAEGSWEWDKAQGILTTYDDNGLEMRKFQVSDSSTAASKERRKDLE